MERVTFKGKDSTQYLKVQIAFLFVILENNNNTESFMKVFVDEDGNKTVNPNFKTEVEAFAGKGFLDA
jgi:hypothetical protein